MVIGINHRTAPVAMRERFWIRKSRRCDVLRLLAQAEGIEEVVVLSTCGRTEFWLWASEVTLAANSVLHFLSVEQGLKLREWEHFYRLLDDTALTHIFRAVSGLDCGRLGEPQIIANVSAAWEQARTLGASGRYLDAVLQKALDVAAPAPDTKEAERFVTAEAHAFHRKLQGEASVPTIVALRRRLNEISREEVDAFTSVHGPFSREEIHALHALATQVSRRMAESLVHELKGLPEKVERDRMTEAVERLFHLGAAHERRAGADEGTHDESDRTPAAGVEVN